MEIKRESEVAAALDAICEVKLIYKEKNGFIRGEGEDERKKGSGGSTNAIINEYEPVKSSL